MSIRYNRFLDDKFLELFTKEGVFNFLSKEILNPTSITKNKYPEFDVQLREDNVVSIYCGQTKVLEIKHNNKNQHGYTLEASNTYKKQETFPTVTSDPKIMKKNLVLYFNNVLVDKKWWEKEGSSQSRFYFSCSKYLTDEKSAFIFDKEVVLGYSSEIEKTEYSDKYLPVVESIQKDLQNLHSIRWSKYKNRICNELDLIGTDSKGNTLYLVEVKANNANAAEVYYSPLQLLFYFLQWSDIINNKKFVDCINKQINQKKEMGLLPQYFPNLNEINKIVPVLAIETPSISQEVSQRFKIVVDSIKNKNAQLKAVFDDFEIWTFDHNKIISNKDL